MLVNNNITHRFNLPIIIIIYLYIQWIKVLTLYKHLFPISPLIISNSTKHRYKDGEGTQHLVNKRVDGGLQLPSKIR